MQDISPNNMVRRLVDDHKQKLAALAAKMAEHKACQKEKEAAEAMEREREIRENRRRDGGDTTLPYPVPDLPAEQQKEVQHGAAPQGVTTQPTIKGLLTAVISHILLLSLSTEELFLLFCEFTIC